MKSNKSWRIRVAQILLGAAIVIALVAIRGAKAGNEHDHMVTDWSHRYAIYSAPRSLMERFELSRHQRYVQQWMRRNAERRGDRDEWRWRRAPEDPNRLHGDWSIDMGSGATVGAGNYPAKFSFDPTSAFCANPAPPVGQQPDFVVYNTSLAGSGSQATIVAFDNLYTTTCVGGPTTYWAYNTGSGGAVVTSPVLSGDGSQVAFVQNASATTANLVIVRWSATTTPGTLSGAVTPPAGPCTEATAPCMTTITFSTANGDTTNSSDSFSSPFYDFANDVLYVGDAGGFLHKFTGVFLGTPTEVVSTTGTFWPASLTGGFGHLNSPVFDDGLNEILVTGSDGVLYAVDATAGGVPVTGVNASAKLANTGFDDGPLVDFTGGVVYVFARADVSTSVPAVIQVPIPATPVALHNATGVVETVGTTAPASAFYVGALDNAYYNSSGTGKLYVCSTSGSNNALWQIPITTTTMGTAVVGPTLTSANVACSPITEFNNGTTDRMFLSVAGSRVTTAPISCPAGSGCLMSFNITPPVTWSGSTPTSAVASEAGGTSGVIVDNSSSAGGASQVYFTPLDPAGQLCTTSGGTGGCAIQASQSGLN